ncbi:unnamed protein product [Ectocarpus sp. 12 AP-2014]
MTQPDQQALYARIVALEAQNKALEEEKRHYQWLAESTTDLISRHARDGTFLYASQAARELLGYEPDELLGVSAYRLFHPSDLSDLLNKSPRVYYRNGFYQQTYRFRAKAGHYVWLETTSRTRRDPHTGELLDILCVSRDVGLRKAGEAQARRHQEQIAHANRLAITGELASNIAHELNQPLGAIANYASGALVRLNSTPTLAASDLVLPLTRIDEQVQRLAERLRHIRSFVRKGSTQVSPIHLSETVNAACQLCEWQFQQAGLQIILELPAALPRVHANPVALEQVLINLLLNALEASRQVTTAKQVLLFAELSELRQVSFSVCDQGTGVDDHQQTAIFAPFHTTRHGGLGMGLAISRSLMEAMGGSLSLGQMSQTTQGLFSGACFVGTLRSDETPI